MSSRPALSASALSHLHPFRYLSAAATHPGAVRRLNEDACLDLPHRGIWAVADGMGGHTAGDYASRAVIEGLRGVSRFDSAFVMRDEVSKALISVNGDLQARADELLVDAVGATVVALLAYESHFACLWAGDSRAYLWRDGILLQITKDHSLKEDMARIGRASFSDNQIAHASRIVTRAVGARPTLDVECAYGRILPGDRFLLCSDGLEILTEAQIATAMVESSAPRAVSSLLTNALHARVNDNVTVVVVEAHWQK